MSPCESASAASTVVTAERSATAPPSSSGTPSIARPSSSAWASSSGGAADFASASRAAGRRRSVAKSPNASWSMACSSEGVRSKRSVRVVTGRAGFARLAAALKVRPAVETARKPSRVLRYSTRSARSRSPRRSRTSEEETVRTARRARPVPRSAMDTARQGTALLSVSVQTRCRVLAEWRRARAGKARSMGEHEALSWRGLEAIDRDGDKLGKIKEIFLDNDTDEPEWAVVGIGMLGRKVRFIPLRGATERDGFVRVDVEKERLEGAPQVDEDAELSADQERELYGHYGLDYDAPGQRSGGGAGGHGHHTEHDHEHGRHGEPGGVGGGRSEGEGFGRGEHREGEGFDRREHREGGAPIGGGGDPRGGGVARGGGPG